MTRILDTTIKHTTLRGLAACVLSLALQPLMAGAALAATTLPVLWTAGGSSAGGDSAGQAAHIASDAAGNVAVVSGPSLSRDLAVTSYTAAGALRWRSAVSPSVGTFRGDWVAAAPNGEFAAVGRNLDSQGRTIASTLVRYSANGTLRWRVDFVAAVTRLLVDGAGNAYLSFGGQDIQVHKYSAAGTLLWAKGATGKFAANSLALSPDQADLLLTGDVIGGATWMTAAFDTATGTRRWQVTAAEGLAAVDVAVDASRVYVTGQGNAGVNGFLTVVAYDRATGARLWRTDANPAVCCANGNRIALAPDGSLVVAGQTTSGGYFDWWIVALERNGAVRWQARRDRAASGDERTSAVFVLADGTTVVAGTGGPTTQDILGNSYMQGVTAGYSPNGSPLWEAYAKLPIAWATALPNGDLCATGGYDALVTCWRISGGVVSNLPPTAVATAAVASGITPLTVTFSGSASSDPDGSIAGYAWSFGDGGTSASADPSHTYSSVGSYSATLKVTDNLGASATSAPLTITATAVPPPPPPPTPYSLSFSPINVVGGRNATATLTVTTTAGVLVALTSSNTAVASVPASVQFPAGSSSATFTVNTARVRAGTAVTIRASANNAFTSGTLNVVPR